MKTIFITLFFIFNFYLSISQTRFSRYIHNDASIKAGEYGVNIIPIGQNYFLPISSADLYLVDTLGYAVSYVYYAYLNQLGDTIWTKGYRKPHFNIDLPYAIQMDNSHFLLAGTLADLVKYKNDTIGFDIYLAKINFNGDTLWTKTISAGYGNDEPTSIIKTKDGGYAIFGQTCKQGRPTPSCDYLLIKLDSNTNFLWKKTYTYASNYWENPWSFLESDDAGFMLFGYTHQIGQSNRKEYLVKTDSVGNKQWQKTYGKVDDQIGLGIAKTKDGNYLITGELAYEFTPGDIRGQAWIQKINPSGSVIWEKEYGGVQGDYFYSIAELPNGEILAQGGSNSFNLREDTDGWLMKMDSSGNKIWQRVYDTFKPNTGKNYATDVLYNMKLTDDGGCVMVGFGQHPDSTLFNQNAWILKVDSFGCLTPGCQIVGIDQLAISREEINISPNPAKELIKLSHAKGVESFRIADYAGKLWKESKYLETGIEVSQLSAGAYIIQVILNNGTQAFGKLIKE